ncbi:MAG: hypothetical protein DSZ28_05715 [Thiothrix sp.]|nr:MAG: hypothetical protein DSZ28_05715 [Thiothrix sp.]
MPKPTVFIIDGGPTARTSLQALVESASMRVEVFDSAKHFIKAYSIDRIGCLVLDTRIPGLNALAVARELSEHKSSLPIIVISDQSDIPCSLRSKLSGAIDFIESPLKSVDFLGYIKTALEHDIDNQKQRLQYHTIQEPTTNTTAKLRTPQLAKVYPWKRLYSELDTAHTSGLVWISGAAGSGKTTLVSSYLTTRDISCLWYRIDEEDNDPASFFYYLAIAARKATHHQHKLLPALTSEFQTGIQTFARRFFSQLFRSLTPPYALVFDNYERIPCDSILHTLLCEAQQTLPEGITIIVTSRRPPPAAFARARASQHFLWIDDEALRLTKEESHHIAQIHSKQMLQKTQLDSIHSLSHGWMAGLILIANTKKPLKKRPQSGASTQAVFDYFAEEVWQRIAPETRSILQQVSILPFINASSAVQLTGIKNAGNTLSKLADGYFFTYRHEQEKETYRFHPLFREFLLEQSQQNLSADDLLNLKQKAAKVLEAEAHYETAFDLYIASEEPLEAARLASQQAPILLRQGRSKTLLAWLTKLPADFFDHLPWLLYWMGAGNILQQPLNSRAPLEKAYNLFKKQDNLMGSTLSCCLIIDTFQVLWDDFHKMDPWIERLEALLEQLPEDIPTEVDARITCAMLAGYVFRRTGHANLQQWEARALTAIHNAPDPFQRIALAQNIFSPRIWSNSLAKAGLLLEKIRPALSADASNPLCKIWLYASEVCYYWNNAETDKAVEAADNALKLSATTGVHTLDTLVHYHVGIANLAAGRTQAAHKNLADLKPLVVPGQLINEVSYHQISGIIAWHEGHLNKAYESTKQAVELAHQAGIHYLHAYQLITLAIILFERGETHEASNALQQAEHIAHTDQLPTALFYTGLLDAYFELQQGRRDSGLRRLNGALDIGRKDGRITSPWWRPHIMSTLCAAALEAKIQTDYICQMISRRKLTPNAESGTLEQWPWPVRIYTLGGLRIEINGAPLRFGSKQPLELLKTLIAMGGQKIKASKLADRLWPDTEGDDALGSFKTTLRRLRKLLQYDDILPLHEGSLSLNMNACWVDSEALLQHASAGSKQNDLAAEKLRSAEIIRLYNGPFLGDEDNISAMHFRERLRNIFLQAISQTGAYYESTQQWRQAIDAYEDGLKVENLTEIFYQRIIVCYQQIDLPAEALRVYYRCRNILEEEFDIQPSTKTKMLAQQIKPED